MTNAQIKTSEAPLAGSLPASPAAFNIADAHIDLSRDGNPTITGVLTSASTELGFLVGRFKKVLDEVKGQALHDLYFSNEHKIRDCRSLISDLAIITEQHAPLEGGDLRFSDTQLRRHELLEQARTKYIASTDASISTAPFQSLGEIFALAAAEARRIGVEKAEAHMEQARQGTTQAIGSDDSAITAFVSGGDLKSSFNDATYFIAIKERIDLIFGTTKS